MKKDKVEILLQHHVKKNFLKVLEVLKVEMKIPEYLVAHPGELRGYINGIRVLDFTFGDDFVFAREGSHACMMDAPNEAACCRPQLPAIFLSTDVLTGEAQAAEMAPEALLEILVLHEMVHVAMMAHLAGNPGALDWIVNPDIRFIHEAAALKACEFCFANLFETATASDIQKYMAYIQDTTSQRPDSIYYQPYFGKLRDVPVSSFWHAALQEIHGKPTLINISGWLTAC